jgi:hypothetical protein
MVVVFEELQLRGEFCSCNLCSKYANPDLETAGLEPKTVVKHRAVASGKNTAHQKVVNSKSTTSDEVVT